MDKLTAVLAISTGLLWTLAVEGVTAQTLDETLIKAYSQNPALSAARARLRAVDEEVPQALSNWRPIIGLTGSAGVQRSDSTTTGPAAKVAEVTEPLTATLSITQNLYRGGRTYASVEEAESNVNADRAHLASVEQLVLLGAAIAYADVVRDQAVLKLNQNNERVIRRQLEATKDRFNVGELTRTDVSQAESRVASARAERIAAEGKLISSRAAYENSVGETPGELQSANPLSYLARSLSEAVDRATARNPNVVRARFLEKAAEHSVQEIAGELLPTITLNGSAQSTEERSTPRSESQTIEVTAQFSMPLYASGSVTSRMRAAKQIVFQRRDEFNQAVRNAVKDVKEAWQAWQTSRAQINAFGAAVKAAEVALEGVREEANVGSRTPLDVLDAEQELLDARVGLVLAKRDELVATFELSEAVGELTAEKLGLSVQLYNPETHYKKVRGKWWGLTAGEGK